MVVPLPRGSSAAREVRCRQRVFEKARSAAQLLGEVAGELEGGVLDVEGAKVLVDVLTRCERLAVAGRGVAARRVATAVNWKHAGHRNPAEWLASTTGVSVGDAARELETAARLEELPCNCGRVPSRVSCRARRRRRSRPARSVDPDAEASLLSLARDGASYRSVRDRCRERVMRASDDAAQACRLHETRSGRSYPGLSGHLVLHGEFAPEVGARVHSVLEQKTDELFRAARQAGTTELRAAYAADALALLHPRRDRHPVAGCPRPPRRHCARAGRRAPR